MAVNPIPEGFHTVTPYLVCEGVDRVLDFLKAAFDAEETDRMVADSGRIMHAQVRLGNSMLMLGEAKEGYPPRPATLYLYVADVDTLYRRALAAGATSLMEPADQFYGDRNAGVVDGAGNQWWIGAHVEDVDPEEMVRRMRAAGR